MTRHRGRRAVVMTMYVGLLVRVYVLLMALPVMGYGRLWPGLDGSRPGRPGLAAGRLIARPGLAEVIRMPLARVFIAGTAMPARIGGRVGAVAGTTAGRLGVWGLHAGHRPIMARTRKSAEPSVQPARKDASVKEHLHTRELGAPG
jgi:hypothetical protein